MIVHATIILICYEHAIDSTPVFPTESSSLDYGDTLVMMATLYNSIIVRTACSRASRRQTAPHVVQEVTDACGGFRRPAPAASCDTLSSYFEV